MEERRTFSLALNPDTRVHAERWTMIDLMESDLNAGFRLAREDGHIDQAARRSFPTPAGAFRVGLCARVL